MELQVLLDMELHLLDTALVQHTALGPQGIVLLLTVLKAMEHRPDMDPLLVILEDTSVSRYVIWLVYECKLLKGTYYMLAFFAVCDMLSIISF